MEINQIIKKIHSEKEGLFLIENNNLENIDLIREEIKNIFYEKQYEIDTCFFENKKLYKYLCDLHSGYLYDVNESKQFNTLTNDLIAIYFTRLQTNLIKYGK